MNDGSVTAESMTVLVVDDSEFFLELLAGELGKQPGIETIAHEDGTTVLDVLDTEESIDCVVTDYEMPDVDGLELLDGIRRGHEDTPVILLTGKGDEDVASEAIKRGASDYITKMTITEDGEIDLTANRIRQAVEQQRTREALDEKREQLRQQNERLEFLNHLVRHDIANELTVAGGLLGGVEPEVSGRAATDLESAIDAIDNAASITHAAGDMVEVFAQGQELDLEPIPLAPLLDAEIEDAQATHPDADIAVEGGLPQAAVRANELLDSVVRNLLSNAVQHNDTDDPRVRVSAETTAETAIVRVADNGPGVPEPAREAIFGYETGGTDSQGMGVGLHLVGTLVDAYNGTVRVENNEPRGAVFEIELPLATTDDGDSR